MLSKNTFGKNILKGVCWIGYYLFVQIVVVIGLCIGYLLSDKFNFSQTSDINALTNEIMNSIIAITVPSLIVSAIVIIITFLLYKLIRKHPFDLKNTKFKESIFCISTGITLNAGISIILTFLSFIISLLFGDILDSITSPSTVDTVLTGQPFWVLLLGTGILVPIMEEIVFRYGFCGTIARNHKELALISSAIIFGVMHGNPIQTVYSTILGFIMGAIYLKYNNLWYPIMIHISINSSSVIVSQLGKEWMLYIAGIITLMITLYMIKKYPELKDFSSLKRKVKPLPSLKDNIMEDVYEETHNIKEE